MCMIIVLMPVSVKAAATGIAITDATYYDSGALESITTNFKWDSADATSRLVLMTNRLRSAGEEDTSVSYGDFTNLGHYGSKFSSFDAVKIYDEEYKTFGIVAYTDEKLVERYDNNYNDAINTMIFSFDEADIPLNVNKTYYVYLWTSWSQSGTNPKYYPDNLFCVIRVQDGSVEYTKAIGQNTYDETAFTEVISADAFDVTITPAANMTKTNESGSYSQEDLTTAMTPVVYTADDGYYFPENYAVATVNGIMVRRDSETQITVYGTPSADASITLSEPTQKPQKLEEITFGYAYDVQRNPAFPEANGTIVLSGLSKPLLAGGRNDVKDVNTGSWTLTKAGTYSYMKNTGTGNASLSNIVSAVAAKYSLTDSAKEGIIIHELKDGDTHIAYGVVIVFDEANGYAGFVGDNIGGSGAGYLLSKNELSSSVTANATMIATDFVPSTIYEIELNPNSTITFDAITEGETLPEGKAVQVINTGDGETGELVVALSGTNADSFALDKLTLASLKVNDGVDQEHISSFMVQPKNDLPIGTYTATVSVSGHNIVTKTVDVTFTVNEAPHTCSLTPVAKVDATCTEVGKEAYYHCNVCGKNYEDAQGVKEISEITVWGNISELGHDWAEATCTTPKTCKRDNCGITEGNTLGHTASNWMFDKDNHWKVCTVTECGIKLDSAVHDFEWKIDKEATETESGSKYEACKVCGYKMDTVEIPATGVVTDQEEDEVNEIPEPAETLESTETPTITQPPQTGDNSVGILWIALMFISSVGVVATPFIRRKFW